MLFRLEDAYIFSNKPVSSQARKKNLACVQNVLFAPVEHTRLFFGPHIRTSRSYSFHFNQHGVFGIYIAPLKGGGCLSNHQ